MRHLLAALACACAFLAAPAWAATLAATPATLGAILPSAVAGDIVTLGPGKYGLVRVSRSGVSFEADPAALFDGVIISGASDVAWRGGRVEIPSAGAVSSTPGVRIVSSKRVRVSGVTILGAIATTGVLQTALPTDPRPGDNVIGLPTGRGISVEFSDSVAIEDVEISRAHKGIAFSRVTGGVGVVGSRIHDVRTSGIVGDAPDNVLIARNRIWNSRPWNFGGYGDHGDFIHLWTPAGLGLTTPTRNLKIVDNLIEQGEGTAILGIFLEDNSLQGFEGVGIAGNTLLNGNAQGIAVSHVSAGVITGNILIQTSGTVKNGPTLLERPEQLSRPGSGSKLTVTGNTLTDLYPARPATTTTAAMERPSIQYPDNKWVAPGVRPAAEIEAARVAALARIDPAPVPPEDPRDARIAALEAELAAAIAGNVVLAAERDAARAVAASQTVALEAERTRTAALLIERTKALDLAKLARAAKAKNAWIDQIVALLSAPAP
jgi:hypothetical protein